MSGIAPAQAPPSGIILFRNIWTRSDPSMTIPLLDDSSGQGTMSNEHLTTNPDSDPAPQSLQHFTTSASTNNDSSTNTTITRGKTVSTGGTKVTGTGVEDLMSRGDVFAGVIVFSVGMLVLIIAVTFYFANGRSLRTVRRNRGLENNNGSSGSAQRRSSRGGANGGSEEVVGAGDVDLEQNAHAMDIAIAGTGAEPGEAGTLEKKDVATFDPHSPSTARLIDHHPSSPSVFAFLKGTPSPSSSSSHHHHRHPSNLSLLLKSNQIVRVSSIISKIGNDFDPPTESTTFHMPVLTRTKARSSCRKKSKGMISLFSSSIYSSGTRAKKQKQKQLQQAVAMEIARSASAIIIQIQEPYEPASATPLDTHSSNYTSPSSYPTSLLDQEEDSLEETFSPIHPNSTTPSTTDDNHHPLLRLEMPTTVRSSSVVGLYGSAKSSPNGSMVDAASTRAIYCTSLKSAISFLPTDSTSMLGAIHTADLGGGEGTEVGTGQDIVIATAGLES